MFVPRPTLRRIFLFTALAVCLVRTPVDTTTQLHQPPAASEVVAKGFENPFGIAVSPAGSIVVSDHEAGTVTEISTDGRRRVLLRRLDDPAGLAFDADGGLLIVEEGAGRVLRRDPSGALGIVASGIVKPSWIAVGDDGAIYVSARRERRTGRRDDDDDDDDAEGDRGERILQVLSDGVIRTFAAGFRGLEGLAVSQGMVYAALRRLDSDRGRTDTEIVRFPVRPDGTAGPTEILLRGTRRLEPVGLAVDRLGALFASVQAAGRGHERGGVITHGPAGEFVTLASTLRSPQGVAFEPAGHLLVVEGVPARQVRRFRAPSSPEVVVPPFTNLSPLALGGRAAPGSLVQVFGALPGAPLAAAVAAAAGGAFTVAVPLRLNNETPLLLTATASGGLGLASAPASHVVVHDDHLPVLSLVEPPPGLYTRSDVPLRARGDDAGSGVAAITVLWDDAQATRFENAAPDRPLEVTASLGTTSLAEGPRALTVTAVDRAGNAASTAVLVTIDRTPPETRIVSGPAGTIAKPAATFVVEGADVLSPSLEFAWRLDAGAWSPFGLVSTIPLTGLTPGEHRFEVKARDLAGNEDATPAVQVFTVRSLRIQITDPGDGAIITTPSVWLRGTYEGAADVSITVPLPSGSPIAALPASAENGTFAVEVPMDANTTTVTVNAVDAATGATDTQSINIVVQFDPLSSAFGFVAAPAAGFAPLVVTFDAPLATGTQVSLDQDSNGTADFEGMSLDGLSFVYNQPGIYVATLRATTPDGQVLTYQTSVEVYDRAALSARVQAVWSGFTTALKAGDVARAVSFIHGVRRAAWQGYYTQLLPAELAEDAALFTAIELVSVGRGGAEYELLREEDGQIFSYPIVFAADIDGRWRLWQF
jgi:hypothetical protein